MDASNNTVERKRRWVMDQLVRCRANCLLRRIEFNLLKEDIATPDVCPVLGTLLYYRRREFKVSEYNCPSLDRLNPRLGYTKGNIATISLRANRLKSDASPAEIIALGSYMADTLLR